MNKLYTVYFCVVSVAFLPEGSMPVEITVGIGDRKGKLILCPLPGVLGTATLHKLWLSWSEVNFGYIEVSTRKDVLVPYPPPHSHELWTLWGTSSSSIVLLWPCHCVALGKPLHSSLKNGFNNLCLFQVQALCRCPMWRGGNKCSFLLWGNIEESTLKEEQIHH